MFNRSFSIGKATNYYLLHHHKFEISRITPLLTAKYFNPMLLVNLCPLSYRAWTEIVNFSYGFRAQLTFKIFFCYFLLEFQ